ncbi:hypothetical protein Lal_00032150 [Lupinus albus]|nr:hypothetical protein Lal_00032150 [Lupinus albus]
MCNIGADVFWRSDGNSSSSYTSVSIEHLVMLKFFNIPIMVNKAPKIIEVICLPPTLGWIKVNTDGAANGSPGHSSGSEIYRDHHGQFITCFSSYMHIQDALFEEIHSDIKAICLAFKESLEEDMFHPDFKEMFRILGIILGVSRLSERVSSCEEDLALDLVTFLMKTPTTQKEE